MTTRIVLNGIELICELKGNRLFSAEVVTPGITEIITGVWSLEQEVIRLVKEAHRKEYREEV